MTLRLTLEIVPFGNESEKRVIETINISNLGKMPGEDRYLYGVEHNKYKTGKYDVFAKHTRSDGALVLSQLALEGLNGLE